MNRLMDGWKKGWKLKLDCVVACGGGGGDQGQPDGGEISGGPAQQIRDQRAPIWLFHVLCKDQSSQIKQLDERQVCSLERVSTRLPAKQILGGRQLGRLLSVERHRGHLPALDRGDAGGVFSVLLDAFTLQTRTLGQRHRTGTV
jgi:hypothetical protein